MKHILTTILTALLALNVSTAEPHVKSGSEKKMILENDLLRLDIAPTGGRIVGLYDKVRRRENAKMFPTVGGLNEFRFHGQLALNDLQSEYVLSRADAGPGRATVAATFALPDGAGTVVKTYTLTENSSDIEVSLEITNESSDQLSLMPWVRHLLLRGSVEQPEEAHMMPHGAYLRGRPVPGHPSLNTNFDRHYFPAGNWTSRVLLPVDQHSNALVSVLRLEDMLKTYNWHRNTEDFSTQEFIALPIFVDPGESRTLTYHIILTAPVRNIVYASPLLVVGASPHPSGIAPETKSLELGFSTTEPVESLQVEAVLNEIGGAEEIRRADFALTDMSPETIRTQAVDVALEEGKAYQLQLRFLRKGKPWYPGAEVGDRRPVIIPLTAGSPHPAKPVYPDRTSELSRLKRIQPREIRAPLLAQSESVQIYSRPADSRVFPEDRFVPEAGGAVLLQAARGEYEALQIVLQSAVDRPQKLAIEAGALSGPDGQKIPCDSVNRFLYVTTRIPSKYNALYPLGTYPEALLPTGEVEVPGNGNTPVFILYRIPENVPAGNYTGEVKIGKSFTVPVRMTVWNVTLPKRSPWYDAPTSLKGLNTGGVVVKNEQGREMSPEELLHAVEDIHFKHRLTPCDSGFTRFLLALDFERFEPIMNRYVENGATKVYLGSIPWVLEHFGQNLSRVEEYLDSKGWQDYFYVRPGFDEASPDLLPKIAEVCRTWKNISTIPIMETYYHKDPEPLFGMLDIYCRGGTTKSPWMEKRMAAGDRFWKVNRKAEPLEGELWKYRRKSLAHFDNSITGTYIWTIKQWGIVGWSEQDYWCDGGVGNLDSVFIWPHETGVLSTIRLETMREAIEDNALLWMLREKLAEWKEDKPQDPRIRAALADARKICDSVPLMSTIHSPGDLYELRRLVGETLSVLNAETE